MAPRITAGRRGRKSAGNGGDGRQLTAKDNMTPEQAAELRKQQEEAEAVQLLSVMSRARAQMAKVNAAKAVYDTARGEFNDICTAAKLAIKLTRKEIVGLLEDSKPEGRRDVAEAEARRHRFRLAMGLPVGRSDEQRQLDERLPEVEREGGFWFEAGFTAGSTGLPNDAPAACVSAGHDNRFGEGWKAGQTVLAATAKVTKQKAAPAPTAEETTAQRKAREKAEEAKAKEGLTGMAKVRGDDAAPALDAVQQAVKAETEGAAPDPATLNQGEGPCPGCGIEPGGEHAEGCPELLKATAGRAADFVEATPEELAAQTTRAAVQGEREAATPAAPETV